MIKQLIAIAENEIGVRETGDNGGKRVLEYQAADTLSGGYYAWCASFISWLLRQLETAKGVKVKWCWSASCDVILAFARSEGILHDTPRVGDVFLVMASKYDATHTGLVVEVDGDRFAEISGNTNDNGSREGNGVYKQWRNNGSRYKFVRWIDLLPSEAPIPKWTIQIGNRHFIGRFQNARVLVKADDYGAGLGLKVGWNQGSQTVLLQGRDVPIQPLLIEGKAWFPVRDLAEFSGLQTDVDMTARQVRISR